MGRRSTSSPARLLDFSNRESSRCCNAMKCVVGASRARRMECTVMYGTLVGVSLPLDGERNLVGTGSKGAMEVIIYGHGLLFFLLTFVFAWFSSNRLLLHLDRVGVPGACCDVLCCVYSKIQVSVNTRSRWRWVVSWAITRLLVRLPKMSPGLRHWNHYPNQARDILPKLFSTGEFPPMRTGPGQTRRRSHVSPNQSVPAPNAHNRTSTGLPRISL